MRSNRCVSLGLCGMLVCVTGCHFDPAGSRYTVNVELADSNTGNGVPGATVEMYYLYPNDLPLNSPVNWEDGWSQLCINHGLDTETCKTPLNDFQDDSGTTDAEGRVSLVASLPWRYLLPAAHLYRVRKGDIIETFCVTMEDGSTATGESFTIRIVSTVPGY